MGKSYVSGICSDNRNIWYHLASTDLLPYIFLTHSFVESAYNFDV